MTYTTHHILLKLDKMAKNKKDGKSGSSISLPDSGATGADNVEDPDSITVVSSEVESKITTRWDGWKWLLYYKYLGEIYKAHYPHS